MFVQALAAYADEKLKEELNDAAFEERAVPYYVSLAADGHLLGGSRRSEIDAWTARFVPRVLADGTFANALERIADHRRRGDHLVLMSASTDLYVPEIARALGFNATICTGVRWDGERLNGSLTTPNRKGEEKARCFTALREQHPTLKETTAYGNSSTDLPHLRLATHGFLVNGSARARQAAQNLGVACVDWR